MGLVDSIAALYNGIAASLFAAQAALVPYGLGMAQALSVLAIMAVGVAFATGSTAWLGATLHGTAAATLSAAAVQYWPEITRASLATVDFVLSAVGIGSGPAALFTLGTDASRRIAGEMIGFSWADIEGSLFESFFAALCAAAIPPLLAVPAILASAARLQIVLSAAVAPLVLPFLAVGLFRGFGMAAFQWQVSGVLKAATLGIVSWAIADQVTRIVTLRGTDQLMGHEAVQQLLMLCVAGLVISWAAWKSAGRVSAAAAGSAFVGGAAAAASGAASVAGGAITGGRSSGAGAGSAGGRAATAGGSVSRSSGIGSAYKRA